MSLSVMGFQKKSLDGCEFCRFILDFFNFAKSLNRDRSNYVLF